MMWWSLVLLLLVATCANMCPLESSEEHDSSEDDQQLPTNTSRIYTEERGTPFNQNYRIYFRDENGPISPFHDIPLFADAGSKIFNMVVEIPRWTNAKMEIATKEPLTPIKQDIKNGNLRFVANIFPHHGYPWNYGALPQTWESPNNEDPNTGMKGDNDPIDVCEIGSRVAKQGDIIQVKILGVAALIDDGETDWKLIAIDINDPLANQLNDIEDVDRLMPGLMETTIEWLKIVKVPSGSAQNQFAFNDEIKNREFAHEVISDTNVQWRALVEGRQLSDSLDIASVNLPFATEKITYEEAQELVDDSPPYSTLGPMASGVDKWYYIQSQAASDEATPLVPFVLKPSSRIRIQLSTK